MKKIVYYTQVCFLDIALEYIHLLVNLEYEVHVIIELPQSQLKANVLSINADLNHCDLLTPFEKVKKEWDLHKFEEYFIKCKTVNFSIFKSNGLINGVQSSMKVRKFIKKIKPDFIHLDDLSPRLFFLIPFYFSNRKKLLLNVHDPKLHLGEFEWKRYLLRFYFFRISSKIVTYSNFSYDQMKNILPSTKKIVSLRMLPYTIYSHFVSDQYSNKEKITFSYVGRISKYKGIEMLLDVIKEMEKTNPDLKFVIAGRLVNGYSLDSKELTKLSNLVYIEKHLSNNELAEIILNSKLVICPYIEATQSGVVMTSIALNRPVLVTKVGALSEYVNHGHNGIVLDKISKNDFINALLDFVRLNKFDEFVKNIKKQEELSFDKEYNMNLIQKIYF